MDHLSDQFAYRLFTERAAELHREADAFRLTRVLADQHAAVFPKARRRLAAGLTGLAAPPASRRRRATATRRRLDGLAATRPAARNASGPQPCAC